MLGCIPFSMAYDLDKNIHLIFFGCSGLNIITGFIMRIMTKKDKNSEIKKRDGYLIVVLGWVFMTIFGSLPFFYIIDGFRYGFLGVSDGSLKFGLLYLIILSFLTWFVSYILFKKGYKIKS